MTIARPIRSVVAFLALLLLGVSIPNITADDSSKPGNGKKESLDARLRKFGSRFVAAKRLSDKQVVADISELAKLRRGGDFRKELSITKTKGDPTTIDGDTDDHEYLFLASIWLAARAGINKVPPQANLQQAQLLAGLNSLVPTGFESAPPGATVYIDDIEWDSTRTWAYLSYKQTYSIRVHKDGFKDAVQKDFMPGKRGKMHRYKLEKE